MTVHRLLIAAAFLITGVAAVVILVTSSTLTALTAIGWIAVALAFYFASLLVP